MNPRRNQTVAIVLVACLVAWGAVLWMRFGDEWFPEPPPSRDVDAEVRTPVSPESLNFVAPGLSRFHGLLRAVEEFAEPDWTVEPLTRVVHKSRHIDRIEQSWQDPRPVPTEHFAPYGALRGCRLVCFPNVDPNRTIHTITFNAWSVRPETGWATATAWHLGPLGSQRNEAVRINIAPCPKVRRNVRDEILDIPVAAFAAYRTYERVNADPHYQHVAHSVVINDPKIKVGNNTTRTSADWIAELDSEERFREFVVSSLDRIEATARSTIPDGSAKIDSVLKLNYQPMDDGPPSIRSAGPEDAPTPEQLQELLDDIVGQIETKRRLIRTHGAEIYRAIHDGFPIWTALRNMPPLE